MKAFLKLVGEDGHVQLEIHAESDVEEIALAVWENKYFKEEKGASILLINHCNSGHVVATCECEICKTMRRLPKEKP